MKKKFIIPAQVLESAATVPVRRSFSIMSYSLFVPTHTIPAFAVVIKHELNNGLVSLVWHG